MDSKIGSTRYNSRYKDIMAQEGPKYLREKEYKGSQKLIARWRCGNEEERNRFWMAAERRNCQICEEEEGTIEHILTHVDRESKGFSRRGRKVSERKMYERNRKNERECEKGKKNG